MKIKIALIAAMALIMQSFAVYADNSFKIINGSGALEDYIVVSGESAQNVSVTVVKKSTDFNSVTPDRIACMDVAVPDADGKINFNWLPIEDGEYDFYISDKKNTYEFLDYPYVKNGTKENILKILRYNDKPDVEEVLGKRLNLRAVNGDVNLYDAIEDYGSLANIFIGIRSALAPDELTNIMDYMKTSMIVEILCEDADTANLDLLINDFEGKTALFDKNFYNENMTSESKLVIAKSMKSCAGKNIDEIALFINDSAIVCGIDNVKVWTELRKYFDKTNLDEYKDLSDKSKDAVDSYFFKTYGNKNYTLLSDIKTDIKTSISNSNNSKPSGGGSGGGGGSKNNSVTVITTPGSSNPSERDKGNKKVFNDVSDKDWFFDSVNYLKWKGIVSGYLDMFYPNNNITRAEALVMLCNAFQLSDLPENNDVEFADVGENDWYYDKIMYAAKRGLVLGSGNGKFNPNDCITRQDAALMVYRFAKLSGVEFTDNTANFTDSEEISDYAKEAVASMAGSAYINGMGNGIFSPASHTTKAEMAEIIYNIIK